MGWDHDERGVAATFEVEDPGQESNWVAEFPSQGRLIWMAPNGAIRELDPSRIDDAGRDHTCPDCVGAMTMPARVREHQRCGHVGLDGFVVPGKGVICQKCGRREGEFPVVATVYSCLRCGRILDGRE